MTKQKEPTKEQQDALVEAQGHDVDDAIEPESYVYVGTNGIVRQNADADGLREDLLALPFTLNEGDVVYAVIGEKPAAEFLG